MLFHFAFWRNHPVNNTPYPYGAIYGNIFKYGSYGVQFFFIISGFVISYTLQNTSSAGAFFKNRFIRLFPPMLLCTILTYLIAINWDTHNDFPEAHSVLNFLPSLSFTHPRIWSFVIRRHLDWTAFVYWSLWVEVQFYIVAAVIYFRNRKLFFRNFILVVVLLNLLNFLLDWLYADVAKAHPSASWVHPLTLFYNNNRLMYNIKDSINWFAFGVVFQHLYRKNKIQPFSLTGVGVLFIFVSQFYRCDPAAAKILCLVMIGLFLCLVYWRKLLFFLDIPLFHRIGVISYTVYLIHDTAGMLLITQLGGYLGPLSFLAPFLTIILVIGFAELSYRLYEKNATRILKRMLFGSKHPPKKLASAVVPASSQKQES